MNGGRKSVIALGMFDGVHMGHRRLIQRAVALAREQGGEAVVYTFANHPMSVFASSPPLLMTLEERVAAISALGVQRVETPLFTSEMADMPPEVFARMLVECYGMCTAVAGFNYTFGKHGAGTVNTMAELGVQMGFFVERVPAVHCHGKTVSSTSIRQFLKDGNAAAAAELLCAPYTLSGEVCRNRHIGTEMGYPTANLTPPEGKLLPRSGVYAAMAQVGQAWYPAVTNIGNNPTVQGRDTTIETHILHKVGDLYGAPLSVRLLDWIRPEMRFSGKAALASQIGLDVEAAHKCFQKLENQAFLDKNLFANPK